MKILITGNPEKDLCQPLVQQLEQRGHECMCLSRANGYDFADNPYGVIKRIVDLSTDADIFINLYANYFFNQTVLAHKVYKNWVSKGLNDRWLVNIGSTTDRVRKGKSNLYHYEKLALREFSNGHSIIGVWEEAPRVSHFSVGTMSNRTEQNPGRKTMPLDKAAGYIVWLLEQPKEFHVNELSIDPMQR
ncbi:MAG: hypothetical protein HRT45_18655 [Bdellovibrionales bacterium]|nr:hypothetical protein [Bdellovibrionales bacterium]